MKKIISVLALVALTLGFAFADMGLGYTGYVNVLSGDVRSRSAADPMIDVVAFDQLNSGTKGAVGAKDMLDSSNSNLTFKLVNDVAGAVFDANIKVTGWKNGLGNPEVDIDQYYGWLTFGKTVITIGAWKSRYVNRLNGDQGAWTDALYEIYKPGFVNYYTGETLGGVSADTGINFFDSEDADNLTFTRKYDRSNKKITAIDATKGEAASRQRLATAVAFTTDNLMLKFVAVDPGKNDYWGYANGYEEDAKFGGKLAGKTKVVPGFAFEGAFVNDAFAVNAFAKTMHKDTYTFGAYINPKFGEGSSVLFGAVMGMYLGNYKKRIDGIATTKTSTTFGIVGKGQKTVGVDLRARIVLSDTFSFTTMNNFSVFMAKQNGENTNLMGMWNMFSGLWTISDAMAVQLTINHEAKLGGKVMGESDGCKYKNFGSTLKFTPGVVLTAGPGATLTTGISYVVEGVGKHNEDAAGNPIHYSKGQEMSLKQYWCVPVIFSVSL